MSRSAEQTNDNSHLPTLLMNEGQRARLWRKTVDSIERYLSEVENYRVVADLDPEGIRALINSVNLNQPIEPLEAIDFTVNAFERYLTHTGHPRYFGLFDPAPATMSIAAEMLVAAFNPQLAAWSQSPFAVEVEQYLVNAFGTRFGYQAPEIDGTFTSGGAEANHTAILTALTKTFPNFAREGLRALSGDPVLYISTEAHHSLVKAARFCGLGSDAVRMIPADDQLRLNTELLSARIQRDKAEGFVPFMIVATAGTTNAGAVDAIEDIANIASREQLWLHTDAAWGGAVALVPELSELIKGIELSDSITFDPHKLLSITRGSGMYLTRHREVLAAAFQVVTPYMPLQQSAGLDVVNPFMHSMQWSRRFIGLKLFLSLLVTGWDGYAEVIRKHVKLARYLHRELEKNGWSVVNDSSLAVVCFFDRTSEAGRLESYLESIAQEVKASGKAWLSTTRLRNNHSMLRACVTNFRSTTEDVDGLISELNLARSKFSHRVGRGTDLVEQTVT
jgi:glutamate/tyrosine decarboxylase-like PLP-dependent enzyme